jgi:hypothetical protein
MLHKIRKTVGDKNNMVEVVAVAVVEVVVVAVVEVAVLVLVVVLVLVARAM